jgi:outer membrane lipoprotein-sorting protein
MVLHESDGEIVHTFDLRDMELKPELTTETFTYEPARGYTVIRPE